MAPGRRGRAPAACGSRGGCRRARTSRRRSRSRSSRPAASSSARGVRVCPVLREEQAHEGEVVELAADSWRRPWRTRLGPVPSRRPPTASPCAIQIRALIAAMGRTSGKKPGRYSCSAWSRRSTASSGSPSASASSAHGHEPPVARSRSSRPGLPSARGGLEVLGWALVEVSGFDVDLAQPHVQVGGRPATRRRAPRPAAARAGRAGAPCSAGRPRATCRRASTVLLSSSTRLPAACRLRHRLRERLQRARSRRRPPTRRGRGTRPRRRGRDGRRGRPGRARAGRVPPCPATSPRAWASEAR